MIFEVAMWMWIFLNLCACYTDMRYISSRLYLRICLKACHAPFRIGEFSVFYKPREREKSLTWIGLWNESNVEEWNTYVCNTDRQTDRQTSQWRRLNGNLARWRIYCGTVTRHRGNPTCLHVETNSEWVQLPIGNTPNPRWQMPQKLHKNRWKFSDDGWILQESTTRLHRKYK
jgi:hypothetical protein